MFLLKEYQKCFRETKQEILETLGEKSFEVSEMYIFGKSKAFCRRLEKVSILYAVNISGEIGFLQRTFHNVDSTICALNQPVKELFIESNYALP